MEKSPIFFSNESRQLIENLAYCMNLKISFFSSDMDEYFVGYHRASSDFCTIVQNNLKVRYRCLHWDNIMCKRCHESGKQQVYRCHAGLEEIILPIHLDDGNTIYMFIGQFRMTDYLSPKLKSEWVNAGFDPVKLEKAFYDRPFFTEERLRRTIMIFRQNIEFLISLGKLTSRKPELVEAVLLYIDRNIHRKITIGEVAEVVSKSESAITHAIKKALGISFEELMIQRRISFFEQIIINNPSIPINEASRMVGYEDELYFSRLYRKKRGIPPSSCINNAQKEYELTKPSVYNL